MSTAKEFTAPGMAVRTAAILFVFVIIFTGLLSGAYLWTKPAIEASAAEEKMKLTNRHVEDEALAIVFARNDDGVAEEIRPAEISEQPLVDRARAFERDAQPVALSLMSDQFRPHAAGDALQRRRDLFGLRIGGQARRRLHIIGIDLVEGMRRQEGPDGEGEGQKDEPDHGGDRGAVAHEAMARIGPERTAGGGYGLTHSAPADRARRREDRRPD